MSSGPLVERRNDPYRRVASFYDSLIEPMQAGVRKVALGVLPPQPEWRVLDVGCGTGTGLAAYQEAGCDVVGVDVSPAMLERAAARLGDTVELHLVSGDRLPFEDDSFDLATTTMVLHEVDAADRREFLTEIARVTVPSGRILIVDFHEGELRGVKGNLLRTVSAVIERFSGHHSGYRSFMRAGGVPREVERAGCFVEQVKVVAGGNVAVYVVSTTGMSDPTHE